MGQDDIIRLLKEHKKLTVREMAELLELTESTVRSILRRMEKWNILETSITEQGHKKIFVYQLKQS